MELLTQEQQEQNSRIEIFVKDVSRISFESHNRLEQITNDLSKMTIAVEQLKRSTDQKNIMQSWTVDTLTPEQQKQAIQALGMKYAIYFVITVPLCMIILSFIDHLINIFYLHQTTVWTINSELLWVCCAGLFAILAFGWKNSVFEILDIGSILKSVIGKNKE